MTKNELIHGTVADGFAAVRDAFADVALKEGDGLEAQLVAYHRGERVVDLWTGPGLDADDLLGVYSVSKGAAHLVVALLVQDGVLDLDEKVARYWPEFAAHGKGELTLRQLLSHQAGLVATDQGFTEEELADEPLVAARLAAQRPLWHPGAAFGYHAMVIAALSGEVVRRVTGRPLQDLFVERVQRPYALDVYLGLPADQDHRFKEAQPVRLTPERSAAMTERATGAHSLSGMAFNRHHPRNPELWNLPNVPAIRRAGPASFGGVASARGLARMYAAAIGSVDGAPPLLRPETAATFAQAHSVGRDLVSREYRAFGVGFQITSEYYPVLGQGSFGHSGAGGQQAFADPRNALSYGYNRRRSSFPGGAAPENDRLIRAVHAAATSRRERSP